MFATKVTILTFLLLGVIVVKAFLYFPCDWLPTVQKSQEVFFKTDTSRSSKPGFPITTNLISYFKVSIHSYLSFKTGLKNCWGCTPLWNLEGPVLPESAFSIYTTPYSNFYFFISIYFIFSLTTSISIAFQLKQTIRFWAFQNMISTSELESGRPEVAKVILAQTYIEIPTRPSRKLLLWFLVSGSELTLSYYYRTLTLKKIRFHPYIG